MIYLRLFIALLFEKETVAKLCSEIDELKKQGVNGNFTKRENLHLTLAFIGEYPDFRKVGEIVKRSGFENYALTFGKCSAFGDIIVRNINCPKELYDYVYSLRTELGNAGVPFDGKKFVPHITLVRKADRLCFPSNEGSVARPSRVALMKSERGRDGMIYTELFSVKAKES